MDPLAITQQDYAELHLIVNNVWLMLVCAFSFSGNINFPGGSTTVVRAIKQTKTN